MRWQRLLVVTIALLVAVAGPLTTPARTDAAESWLDTINAYRAAANISPVADSASMDSGDAAHAQYMVKNSVISHSEDPTKPYFTAGGQSAGLQSNVMTSAILGTSDRDAIDQWMTGPFHAAGIIDPNLRQVGFGSYREPKSGPQMAAALNIIQGRSTTPVPGNRLPVLWPGNGASVPLTRYAGEESPDPLTSCPGYTPPTGLPIILETGGAAAAVSGASISTGGHTLSSCELDARNYGNPDGPSQASGRGVLATHGAVVLIPRLPLTPGSTYQARITVNGVAYEWSFSVNGTRSIRPAGSIPAQSAAGGPVAKITRPAVPPVTAGAAPVIAPDPSPQATPSDLQAVRLAGTAGRGRKLTGEEANGTPLPLMSTPPARAGSWELAVLLGVVALVAAGVIVWRRRRGGGQER
jgi:hypothetical protein